MIKEQGDVSVCPVGYALKVFGGKWKLNIVWKLSFEESLRYSELKRRVSGITNMMLSQCLAELQEAKIVNRVQYSEIPPRVEYSLTDSGKELLPVLKAIATWGTKHMQEFKKVDDEK